MRRKRTPEREPIISNSQDRTEKAGRGHQVLLDLMATAARGVNLSRKAYFAAMIGSGKTRRRENGGAASKGFIRFLICDREFHFATSSAIANPMLSHFGDGSPLLSHGAAPRSNVAVGRDPAQPQGRSEIAARLRASDPASIIAASDHHLYRIYITTRATLDAMGHRRSDASTSTREG
jgi:DNA-binding FadR family transcriptional regulator